MSTSPLIWTLFFVFFSVQANIWDNLFSNQQLLSQQESNFLIKKLDADGSTCLSILTADASDPSPEDRISVWKFKQSYFLGSLSLVTFTSFRDNKLALQLLDGTNQELIFFYMDLKTNELAFRGHKGKCRSSKVPELFKIDLINYHNLWDYLFFLQTEGHWRLEWPINSGFLNGLFSELHYLTSAGKIFNCQFLLRKFV